ncbi:MAG: lactate utilization protein [Deltaproteobacteria bacterium]|nr:lactate utilization protein [Deltaproteobacteria bacterium]
MRKYWEKRLEDLKGAFEANNFEVFIADSTAAAKDIVVDQILPDLGAKSVSFGGSITVVACGLYSHFKDNDKYDVVDTFDRSVPMDEMLERRRQSLHVDLFLSSTNAMTESGQLVNLDMLGNRIAGITFGPKNVIILVGRNKLTADLEEAMFRIKNYAAPINAMRLKMKTPCAKTGICEECKSPSRICNTWMITEKSFGKGRVKIVLINEDLGF